MKGWRSRFLTNRAGAIVLVVLALCLRALLPAGTMPVHDEVHGIRVLLCDGTGAHTGSEIPQPSDQGHNGNSPCAFSVLAVPALSGGSEISLPVVYLQVGGHVAALALETWPGDFAHARPPQRGPPDRV